MSIKIAGAPEIESKVLFNGMFLISSEKSAIRLTPRQAQHLIKYISESMESANAKYHEYERGK